MTTAKRPAKKTSRKRSQGKAPSSESPLLLEVEKRDGVYRIVDPGLEIAVSNAKLEDGFNELNALRQKTLESLKEAGFPPPGDSSVEAEPGDSSVEAVKASSAVNSGSTRKGPSWLGMSAVMAVVIIVALLAIPVLDVISKVNSATARIKEAARAENVTRTASQSLIGLAETLKRVTPARREEIRQSLRSIVVELKPYASELAPLFEADAARTSVERD